MASGRHQIGNLELQLSLPNVSVGEANAMVERITQKLKSKVIPGLQSIFDAACPEDQVLQIEHLQIDLGKLSLENLEAEIVRAVLQQIGEKLEEKGRQMRMEAPALSAQKAGNRLLDLSKRKEEAVLNFLQKGHVEAIGKAMQMEEMAKLLQIWTEKDFQKSSESVTLNPFEIVNESVQTRILVHFPTVFIQKILPVLIPKISVEAKAFLEKKIAIRCFTFWERSFLSFLWKQRENPVWSEARVRQLILDWFKSVPIFSKEQDISRIIEEFQNEGKPEMIWQRFWEFLDTISPANALSIGGNLLPESGESPEMSPSDPSDQSPSLHRRLQSQDYPDPKGPSLPPEPASAPVDEATLLRQVAAILGPDADSQPADGRSHFIDLAGLVLLSPFLPLFFQKLSLLADNGLFKSPEETRRAVCLLHFLACGQEKVPEFELPMAKVICGLDLETPVWLEHPFTEGEIAECESLLESVIEHWEALKGSSIEALREGFLQRQGRLEASPTGWRLLVEKQTLDILLARIPWSFSIVKYPWMKEMMFVDWG